jgi:hypothetical protein
VYCQETGDACVCPNDCVQSNQFAFTFYCERLCNSDGDCSDPGQRCFEGQCTDNPCGPNLGQLCDLVGGSAVPPADAGVGTCLIDSTPAYVNCTAPGTATGACRPVTSRDDAADRCALGLGCVQVFDGGYACEETCATASDCGSGSACIQTLSNIAICLPLDDAGVCALGQSSPPAKGVCGKPEDDPCGCGYDCVGGTCKQRCERDSDCPTPGTVCVGTIGVSYCVPGGG